MRFLRRLGLAAVLVVGTCISSIPANAAGGLVFSGVADINCWGCGISNGVADLWVTGVVGTTAAVAVQGVTPPNAAAAFTVNVPGGVSCNISGTASGSVSGVVNVDFNWTRVGAVAVVTTSGDVNGAGGAIFTEAASANDAPGATCGRPIRAFVAGAIAGA